MPSPNAFRQRGNLNLEIVLLDGQPRPYLVEQRILGDRLAARSGQHAEYVERTPSKRNFGAGPGQATAARIQPERAERHGLRTSADTSTPSSRLRINQLCAKDLKAALCLASSYANEGTIR